MALFFLQESSEKSKCMLKIKNILNKIEERKEENNIFLNLPIKSGNRVKNKKTKKIVERLEEYKIRNLILAENLNNMESLKNHLYSKNINILDGRYLFKLLIEETIYYICKNNERDIEEIEISILINDASSINKEIIMNLAEKVKTLNIITNHIKEFKQLEDYLFNEKGVIVKISNNYKIAMQKTDIIFNIDFPEEIINKYFIPNKCIIVSLNGEIKIKTKKFNGINIKDYNIKIPKKYKINGYNDKHVYEGYLLNKDYKMARKQILDDRIEIKNLVGEKGEINNIEFSFMP